jgi:hypothetical protein
MASSLGSDLRKARGAFVNWISTKALPRVIGCIDWIKREISLTRPRTYLVFFLGLTVVFWICSHRLQPWIELLNGATWPTAATPPPTSVQAVSATSSAPDYMRSTLYTDVGFNAVLAVRTMLNISGMLAVLAAILAYPSFKEGRVMKMKVMTIMRIRDLSVSRKLHDALKRDPELKDNNEALADLVKKFGTDFEREELPALLNEQGLHQIKSFELSTS